MLRHWLACILLVFVLVGCSSAAASVVATKSLGPGERWLAAVDWTGRACGGVGLVGDAFRLHGSPTDPHLARMTWSDGSRRELVWNSGTSARFDPNGTVIAREGSIVTGYCLAGDPKYPNALFVEFAPSAGLTTSSAPGPSGDVPTP